MGSHRLFAEGEASRGNQRLSSIIRTSVGGFRRNPVVRWTGRERAYLPLFFTLGGGLCHLSYPGTHLLVGAGSDFLSHSAFPTVPPSLIFSSFQPVGFVGASFLRYSFGIVVMLTTFRHSAFMSAHLPPQCSHLREPCSLEHLPTHHQGTDNN